VRGREKEMRLGVVKEGGSQVVGSVDGSYNTFMIGSFGQIKSVMEGEA